jgi:hypothetical protein
MPVELLSVDGFAPFESHSIICRQASGNAGKQRKGIAAANILSLLGSPLLRQRSPFPLHNEALTEGMQLRNMPAGGKLHTVTSIEGRITIKPQPS